MADRFVGNGIIIRQDRQAVNNGSELPYISGPFSPETSAMMRTTKIDQTLLVNRKIVRRGKQGQIKHRLITAEVFLFSFQIW